MRKSKIKPVSDKQKIEIAKRKLLKWELFIEQRGLCAKCGKSMSYRAAETSSNFPHLSHKKPLSDGGKTTRRNCSILCAECHGNTEHNQRNIYNEQPQWGK